MPLSLSLYLSNVYVFCHCLLVAHARCFYRLMWDGKFWCENMLVCKSSRGSRMSISATKRCSLHPNCLFASGSQFSATFFLPEEVTNAQNDWLAKSTHLSKIQSGRTFTKNPLLLAFTIQPLRIGMSVRLLLEVIPQQSLWSGYCFISGFCCSI